MNRLLCLAAFCCGLAGFQVFADAPGSLLLQARSPGLLVSICWSDDGRYLLTGGSHGQARLWNVDTGRVAREYAFGALAIEGVACGPDLATIVLVDENGLTRVVDVRTGRCVHEFRPQVEGAKSQQFRDFHVDEDGILVLTQSEIDRPAFHEIDQDAPPEFVSELTLWNATSGESLQTFRPSLKPYWEEVGAAAFSWKGRRVVMTSPHRVFLWDLDKAEPSQVIKSSSGHSAAYSTLLPDGNGCFVDTGDMDSNYSFRMIGTPSGKSGRLFGDHGNRIGSVVVSPDGRQVLSLSDDHAARLWDVETGKLLRINVCGRSPSCAAFRPDGKAIALVLFGDGISIWDLTVSPRYGSGSTPSEFRTAMSRFSHPPTGKEFVWESQCDEIRFPFSRVRSAHGLTVSPDGTHLGVSSEQGALFWNLTPPTRRITAFFGSDVTRTSPAGFVFSPDGSRAVVMGSWNVWNIGSGLLPCPLEPPNKSIRRGMEGSVFGDGMRQQPDGSWRWAGSHSSSTSFEIGGRLNCCFPFGWAMTGDGSLIAYATYASRHMILLWDGATGRIRHVLPGLGDWCAVAFTQDEKRLIAAGRKECVVWEVESGKKIADWPLPQATRRCTLVCHPDGLKVTIGTLEGRIDTVDLADGHSQTLVKELEGHLTALAYSPDFTELAACVHGDDACDLVLFDPSSGEVRKRISMPKSMPWQVSLAYVDADTLFCNLGAEKWFVVDRDSGTVKRQGTIARYPAPAAKDSKNDRDDQPYMVTLNPSHYAEPTANGDVRLYDGATGEVLGTFDAFRQEPGRMTLSSDGSHLLNRTRNQVGVFNLQTGACAFEATSEPREQNGTLWDFVVMAALGHDGGLLALEEAIGVVVVCDTSTGRERHRIATPPRGSPRVRSMAFNHDSSRLAIGLGDSLTRIYDMETGEELGEIDAVSESEDLNPKDDEGAPPKWQWRRRFEGVAQIAFTSDGRKAFTVTPPNFQKYAFPDGAPSQIVQMWDAETFKQIGTFPAQSYWLISPRVVPNSDGSLLLTRIKDDHGTSGVALLDTATGEPLRTFEAGSFASDFKFLGGDRFAYVEVGAARGTVYSVADGAPVAVVQGFDNGDWAVIATDGRFDTSSADAMERFGFLPEGSLEATPATEFRETLYCPGLLPKLLQP